eukprot:4810240-Ditylum_brightwellii.AAC.1
MNGSFKNEPPSSQGQANKNKKRRWQGGCNQQRRDNSLSSVSSFSSRNSNTKELNGRLKKK